ncbi:MAG: hypothetical protein ABSH14_13980 [Verrucomicrobiia bacterium]|jgi:hypothetical protein
MKRLTRVPAIIATALLLAFFCGCGKFRSHKQAPKPRPAPGMDLPRDPRDIETPGFQIPQRARTGHVKTGVLMLPDGSVYEGQLNNRSVPDGEGHVLSPNGTDQHGEWRFGRMYRVTGTWVARDGTKEVGTWYLDGNVCGGTIYWTNGWKYVGDWWVTDANAELPHGEGVLTSPDGKVTDGLWKQGNFVGPKP